MGENLESDGWEFSYTLDSSIEATRPISKFQYEFRMLFAVYEDDAVISGTQDDWGVALGSIDLSKEKSVIRYVLESQGWSSIDEYMSYYDRPFLCMAQDVGIQKFYSGNLLIHTFPTLLEAFTYMRDMAGVSSLVSDLLPTDMARELRGFDQESGRVSLGKDGVVLDTRPSVGLALVMDSPEGEASSFSLVSDFDPKDRSYASVDYRSARLFDAACMFERGILPEYLIDGVSPEQVGMWVHDFLEKPTPTREECREIAARANAVCSPGDGDLFDAVAKIYRERSREALPLRPDQARQAASPGRPQPRAHGRRCGSEAGALAIPVSDPQLSRYAGLHLRRCASVYLRMARSFRESR